MEERGTKARFVMKMRVGFEKHGEAPYTPYLDESRGERQAGAKWWALMIQILLCVQWNTIEGFET